MVCLSNFMHHKTSRLSLSFQLADLLSLFTLWSQIKEATAKINVLQQENAEFYLTQRVK